MKIALIMPVKNQLAYTVQAVLSMITTYPYEWIFLDDGSTDGTRAFIEQYRFCPVSGVPSLGGKWNVGMATAKLDGCKLAVILNNDVILQRTTIDTIVSRLLVGDVQMVTASNIAAAVKNPKDIHNYVLPDIAEEPTSPDFSCFGISIATWETIGGFPEIYEPCYFEDNHIHWTMMALDMKAIRSTLAPYYHYGSVTQRSKKGGICTNDQFARNRRIFIDVWGADPQHLTLEKAKESYAKRHGNLHQ
jgi:glycosyltransferase involved in cell wall biosynthesis